METFAQKHPGARVELFDLSSKEMLAGVENETLDVVITVRQERDGHGLKWTPLVRASWQLAVNRSHSLAKQPRVNADDVAREPLLVFRQRDYPEYWKVVTGWLRDQRQRPVIAGEYDGVDSLLTAVESGLGVALVTTSTARLLPERVQLKALSAAPAPLRVAAVRCARARAPKKPLTAFIEELDRAARTLESALSG